MNVFSQTCEYAFRALTHLAVAESGQDLLGRELAERASIPASYLSKILLTLKHAGIVEATRGTGGGYRLARPAKDITLAEVIDILDPPRSPGGCFLGGGRECSNEAPCPGHESWLRVKEAFLEFTTKTTLNQIALTEVRSETVGGSSR